MKLHLSAMAAGCALVLLATPLHAQPYSSLIVFGDSLSDAGQLPDLLGPAGATVRYTNRVGPTYLDNSGEAFGETSPMMLARDLGLGAQAPSTSALYASNGWADGNNWATGGYRTDQIRDSIIAPGGSATGDSSVGTRTRDGYIVELASKGQRIDPNALFYVNGGGNDFLQGTIFTMGEQAAAGQLADGIEALQRAGARTIIVSLLPDVGITPAISITTMASTVSAMAQTYNTHLVERLEQINAQIIPLNAPLLFEQVLADAGAFGFDASQDLTGTCFNCAGSRANARWGLNSATPDPSKLLYNDTVHPTAAAQKILSDYAYSLLAAPWELSLLPEMGHSLLRGHQAQLRQQWLADALAWQDVGQWRSSVSVGAQRLDLDRQTYSAKGKGKSFGFDLGGSYRLDEHWRLGLGLAVDEQTLKAGVADSKYHMRGYVLSGFAQYQREQWWSDLLLSGGYLDYHKLNRRFDLGITEQGEKGSSNGQAWAAAWRVGYELAQPSDSWQLSPFVSADYADVELDRYRESGATATALRVDQQSRVSKRLGLGLQGAWQVAERTQVAGQLSRQREFKDDAQHVRMALTSLPTLDYRLAGFEPDRYLDQLTLSVTQQLQPELSVFAGYNLSRSGDLRQQGVNVGVQIDW